MLFTVLLGFLVACLLVPFGKYIRNNKSVLLSIIPAFLFLFFLRSIPEISSGKVLFESTPWVPALGVNLSFRLDGLSLLFALMITGIGTLVFVYASSYLKGDKYIDRFFGYLLLFMSAMLGLVLSNNVILTFIFWELTSISSFFLIGFNNDSAASRKSALTALAITGLGGFFLLVGLVFAGFLVDSYSIGDMFAQAAVIKSSKFYPVILACFLLGAFTKSAQFPFHFWLPGAMKAPTPVSAYLHSATMVKAGIFVMARFTPILGGTMYWQYALVGVGGFTMVYAGIQSLTKTDMKGGLAYSTISALGILTFLIGLGTGLSMTAACAYIIMHALYKAPLFLVTGIVDHETGTRDLMRLSGLGKAMPLVFVAGAVAGLSSAGLPLTFGFIGKDLIYESTLNFDSSWSYYLVGIAVLTNLLLVAAGLLIGFKPFVGAKKDEFAHVHMPPFAMWFPPVLIGIVTLVFGFFPSIPGDYLTEAAVKGILQNYVPVHLKIWHGFNTVLILSLATLLAGLLLFLAIYFKMKKGEAIGEAEKRFSTEMIFSKIFVVIKRFATWYTDFLHNGYLRSYLFKVIVFAEILLIYELIRGGTFALIPARLTPITAYDLAIFALLGGALYKTIKTNSRLTAVVSMSVVGYAICLLFVIYSAPDLAMTQFTIDTLTTVLFVLVLYKLPPFLKFKNKPLMIRDGVVSMLFGVILSLICLRILQEPTVNSVSDFYAKYAYTLGKGKNVVNVILVDFRGFDTMFEIVVLSVAAIGVYSLLKLRLKSSEKE